MKLTLPLSLSILLHLLLLGALVLHVEFAPRESVKLGDASVTVVQSYFMHDHSVKTQQAQRKTSLTQKNANVFIKKKVEQAVTTEKSVRSSRSQGETADALLTLLHEAIQAKQSYPESAMVLERQGRVQVAFMLFKNGTVDNIHIQKSSGTASLDEAALAAVRDAAPFQSVTQYLQSPTSYAIDVVFSFG